MLIDASSTVHPIHAETDGLEGWLELDVEERGRVTSAVRPQAHIEFDVDRLRSGNALEDRELKRRIDARRFPRIVGDLSSLESLDAAGRHRVSGDVTFKGVTRSASDDIDISVHCDDGLRLRGSSLFDIRDFGMEPPRILMLRVSPEVKVTVDILARREG